MLTPVNGIRLNVERAGRGDPLLLLHGFTGSVATWAPYQPIWTAQRQTIAIDIIGHGASDSPEDPERYGLGRGAADLLALLDRLGIEQIDLLGYSMGARLALHLATTAPARVRTLILESGSPGLADSAERDARCRADHALADRIEREGLTAFVDHWERLPLFASQERLPAAVRAALRAQRLRNDPRGLANSLRGMGTGRQEPLWDRLADLPMPVLLIVGAMDEKYVHLARRMAALLPATRLVAIPDAGHAVHLEQPGAFGDAIAGFLAG